MPFERLYCHIVWATSHRDPTIVQEIEAAVYKAIGDKAKLLGGKVFAVGGAQDHVHMAGSIPPTIALSNFVSQVKGASAYHINHVPEGKNRLCWQRGYGVLSFSRDQLDRVVNYIKGQKEHHKDGKLWPSLEECGEEAAKKPMMVKEDRAEYDPFA